MRFPFKIKIPPKVTNTLLKIGEKIGRKKPEIFLVFGIGCGIGGIIISNVNTWKNKEKLIEDVDSIRFYKEYDAVEEAKKNPNALVLTENERRENLSDARMDMAIDVTKSYGIPVVMTIGSIIFLVKSHAMLRHELATMTTAYALLLDSYKKYRQNVIDDVGREKDQQYMHGIKMVDAIDAETGEVYKKAIVDKDASVSRYAKWFDEGEFDGISSKWIWRNPHWCSNKLECIRRVKMIQSSLNDIFHTRGWMKLNEAYMAYGLPCTEDGEHVGWVMHSGHDDFIDVGVFPSFNNSRKQLPINQLFLDERHPQNACLLDFNVDGSIDYIFKNILEFDNRSYVVGNQRKLKG